ncbi:hypothetical protein F5X71_27140 [Nocardia brasiliensis]|uniref:Uncharacterized protein n=1 Tax=Nocardia brasiliensis TaxID=37326 RepID=A0A6G9XX41_NOCBR|nr:hypothetical protein [Nocardia brasiliensis]QIS05499.1 hypothetical protein F5X71_27140 [Nocardia brasiliensis]
MPAAMVYTCRVTNWPMLWIYVIGFVSAIFVSSVLHSAVLRVLFTALWIIVLVRVIIGTSQRVSVGPGGLTVILSAFGFPRVSVARASIARAEIIDVPVTFWSRLGVYWTRKRGWFLTPTWGPALRLTLTSGRMVTVSMPEPAAALAAMGITA